jgi:hypothetical protein
VGVAHTGSGVQDSYCSPPTLEVKAAIREMEQRRSCRFFGLPDASLAFLHLEEDATVQPIASPKNLRLLRDFVLPHRPDIVFMPHGHDTNAGHQRMYYMFQQVALEAGYPLAALLNRDPKTISMRMDLYTAFEQEEAAWKAKLLRCHDSQQQRNLNTRGYGFDERILKVNRQIARELELSDEASFGAAFAEAFELELYGTE